METRPKKNLKFDNTLNARKERFQAGQAKKGVN